MNSDSIADGILKAVMVLAIGWAVLAFFSRNEWAIYIGLALFVAGGAVFGIRDAGRQALWGLREIGGRGLVLRACLSLAAACACGGFIVALLGLLWLTGPDSNSGPGMIAGGIATLVGSIVAMVWCECRMKVQA